MLNRPLFAAVLLAIGISAMSCGGGPAASSGGSNSADSPAPAATAKGSAAMIHLVLTGGPSAGTFDLNSSEKCQFLTQPTMKIWQANWSDTSPTAKIVNFTISVDIMPSPTKFTVVAAIPSSDGLRMYAASTFVPGGGGGTGSVQDGGATAKISADGKTKEGYGVTATVQCNQVERLP